MILLTTDEIIKLHEKLIEKTGGSSGLRDFGLLESAVFSAENAFGDVEQYPTVEEKAARLMFALANNHAFVDGNKRIGVLIMFMTLELNGILLSFTQKELIDFGLSVADGTMDYFEILDFIKQHQ